MRKKYFFFDIDGTLTDRQTNLVVPSAQRALDELQANGHFVAIATGRAHYKAVPMMQHLGLHQMVCAGGGALVLDDQLIVNQPLDTMKARKILQQADSLGIGFLVSLSDSPDVYAPNNLFREQVGERQEPTIYHIDPALTIDTLDTIFKIYLALPKGSTKQLPDQDLLPHLHYVPDYLLYQFDQKDVGILRMMNHLQAPLEDVVVFGDDVNDLVMFDPRWTSIAMGNATASLKVKADFVAKANVEDGIYDACQQFGWL